MGGSAIGALTYAPASSVWEKSGNTLDLGKLAADSRLVLDGDVSEVISMLGQAGGSPGGVRPKALVAVNSKGHAVHGSNNIADGYAHCLVKFPGRDDPEDIAAIEMAYATMAKDAGVIMPETRLLQDSRGQAHFAPRRFDREGERRVHVQSASGAARREPRSYNRRKALHLLNFAIACNQKKTTKINRYCVWHRICFVNPTVESKQVAIHRK